MIASGRWHTAPKPVIYCADHPSTALLEVLVHLEVTIDDIPRDYQLIEINIPDSLEIFHYVYSGSRSDWPILEGMTQIMGNEWIDECNYAAISVPSAILPIAKIFILNASHPRFSDIKVVSAEPVLFDTRLLKMPLP